MALITRSGGGSTVVSIITTATSFVSSSSLVWTTGQVIVATVGLVSAGTVTSISNGGSGLGTWFRATDGVTSASVSNGNNRLEIWWAVATGPGTGAITANLSQSATGCLGATAFSNVNTTAPWDKIAVSTPAAGIVSYPPVTSLNPNTQAFYASVSTLTQSFGAGVSSGYSQVGDNGGSLNTPTYLSEFQMSANSASGTVVTPGSTGLVISGSGVSIGITALMNNTSTVVTMSLPTAPTGLTATYVAGQGIDLAWTAPAGYTGVGYNIYRSVNNKNPKKINNDQPYVHVPNGTVTFRDRLLGYPAVTSGENAPVYYVTTVLENNVLITLTGSPAGGNVDYTVTDPVAGGPMTASAVAYNASASTLQTALNALTNVAAAGGVVVYGANGGPYTVFGTNQNANDIFTIEATSHLTGGSSPGVTITPYTGDIVESVPSNTATATFLG